MPVRLQMSLLTSVFEFMSDSGVSEKQIASTTQKCLGALSKRKATSKSGPGEYQEAGDLAADILRVWHRDEAYLSANGAVPRPLYLDKGRHNLNQLAKRLNPSADVGNLMDFLLDSGLVRRTRDGRYLPSTEAGAISKTAGFVSEHTAKSVVRLLSTVKKNAVTESGSQSLIERFAYVSDLDPGEVEEFCAFTRSHGHNYLQLIDDWMEQRRVRKAPAKGGSSTSGVTAGVQVVAYVGEPVVLAAAAAERKKRRNKAGGLA